MKHQTDSNFASGSVIKAEISDDLRDRIQRMYGATVPDTAAVQIVPRGKSGEPPIYWDGTKLTDGIDPKEKRETINRARWRNRGRERKEYKSPLEIQRRREAVLLHTKLGRPIRDMLEIMIGSGINYGSLTPDTIRDDCRVLGIEWVKPPRKTTYEDRLKQKRNQKRNWRLKKTEALRKKIQAMADGGMNRAEVIAESGITGNMLGRLKIVFPFKANQREIEERHKRMIELAGTEMKLDSVFAAKELGCSIKTAKRAMRALGIENTRKTKAG